MPKRALSLIASFLIAVGAISAAEPWKNKDPHSWDAKDVQKILQDSPWSHKIQFGMGGASAMPGPATGSGSSPLGGPDRGLGSGGATGIAGTSVSTPPEMSGPRSDYTISWISSRTIREARARRRELGGVATGVARRDLGIVPEHIEIMVAGSDMAMLGRQSEDQFKATTYLLTMSAKERIVPSGVRIERDQIGEPAAVVFLFNRTDSSGAPAFPPNEKGVEFVTSLGKIGLKTRFDFSKMRDKQGLDL